MILSGFLPVKPGLMGFLSHPRRLEKGVDHFCLVHSPAHPAHLEGHLPHPHVRGLRACLASGR